MTDNELLDKGHWVKFFPKLLHSAVYKLSSARRLIVYDIFNENGWTGKPIPHYKIDILFSEIPNYREEIEILVRAGVISQNEEGDIFLPFIIDAFSQTRNDLLRRREAGRRGGLKSARNKVATTTGSTAQPDKDKDKDKDKDSSIISLSKDNSSFSQTKNDIVSGQLDDLQGDEDLSETDDTRLHQQKLIEPELIEEEPKSEEQPSRKPTSSQSKAIAEAVKERWNTMAAAAALPKVRAVTPERTQKLANTIKKLDLTLDQVLAVIDTIPDSNFLSGRSTDFKATFAWFIKTENLNKIIDGNYHDEKSNRKTPGDRVKDEFLRYIDNQEQADGQGD